MSYQTLMVHLQLGHSNTAVLHAAKQITVLQIAAEDDEAATIKRLDDVVVWLKSHDIVAKPLVSISKDADSIQFLSIAKQQQADIVITGAYRHSRFREWVLGGVTNELLQGARYNSFLSH